MGRHIQRTFTLAVMFVLVAAIFPATVVARSGVTIDERVVKTETFFVACPDDAGGEVVLVNAIEHYQKDQKSAGANVTTVERFEYEDAVGVGQTTGVTYEVVMKATIRTVTNRDTLRSASRESYLEFRSSQGTAVFTVSNQFSHGQETSSPEIWTCS